MVVALMYAGMSPGEMLGSLETGTSAGEVPIANASRLFKDEEIEICEAAGIEFLMWPGRDDLARFVFGHSTSEDDTVRLIEALDA